MAQGVGSWLNSMTTIGHHVSFCKQLVHQTKRLPLKLARQILRVGTVPSISPRSSELKFGREAVPFAYWAIRSMSLSLPWVQKHIEDGPVPSKPCCQRV